MSIFDPKTAMKTGVLHLLGHADAPAAEVGRQLG
jgi:hypothetical protein